MVNNTKTRLMTKCAIYEKNIGKEDIEMSKYFKSDYVRLHIVKTIVFSTIGYLFMLAIYALYIIDYFLENAFEIDYQAVGVTVLVFYIIILSITIGITWFGYSMKYRTSRARLSKYYKMLGRINKLNEDDERLKDLEES